MVRAYRWQWSAICFFCFSPIIRAAKGYGYSYNRNLFAFSRAVYEKHAVHENKRAVHENKRAVHENKQAIRENKQGV